MKINRFCIHKWKCDFLTEDLVGYECIKCGKQTVDLIIWQDYIYLFYFKIRKIFNNILRRSK